MKIRNVVHKGLRRFIEEDDVAGLQPAVVPKLRRIVSFLQDMEREEELRTVSGWKAQQLAGNRKGSWSLLVTRNWRLTFRVDPTGIEIIDLDFEDYHEVVDMTAMQGIRMKNPAHPGSFVKCEIIAELGLSVTDAAKILGVTRAALEVDPIDGTTGRLS